VQIGSSSFGSHPAFYDWSGIIRANWHDRPAVIRSANHWISQKVEEVEARHPLMQYAMSRYDALRQESEADAPDIFTSNLTHVIAEAV
jgi:hypothetical protein